MYATIQAGNTSHGGNVQTDFNTSTDVNKLLTRRAQVTLKDGEWYAKSYFLSNASVDVTADNCANMTYYIDNIRIYRYHGFTVTFDANGESATVPASVAVGNGNDLILKSYAPSNYSAERTFKGWSLTPDGEVLSGSLKITSDITLYAIFGDTQPQPHPGYSVTFNNSGAFSKYFNNPNSSNDGASPRGEVTASYVNENGGFERFTFKSVSGAANSYVGDPKMEAKNFATPLYTKNIKGISVKYRFSKIPDDIKERSVPMSFFLKVNDPAAYRADGTLAYPDITQGTYVYSAELKFADNEWHTAYIDLAGKNDYRVKNVTYKWSDFDRMQNFRFDILNWAYDGLVMDVAGIDFVLSDDVTLDVNKAVLTSANGADAADYRNGVLNVTYESDPGYTADEFYAAAITDAANVFSGTDNVEKIANTDGSVTYRMYAVKSLIGQTVYVKSALKEEVGSITGSLGTAVEYKAATFDDGENIIPNGDFSNKFYNIWSLSEGTTSIENGSLKAVIGRERQSVESIEHFKHYVQA